MTDAFQYRIALPADAHLLARLRVEFLESILGEHSQAERDHLQSQAEVYYRDSVASGEYLCILAFSGEKIAGVGGMVIRKQAGSFKNPSGVFGYIMNIYTLPGFRRRGISKSIMLKLEEEGKKAGLNHFELLATKEGRAVYEQIGYHIHPEPVMRKQS